MTYFGHADSTVRRDSSNLGHVRAFRGTLWQILRVDTAAVLTHEGILLRLLICDELSLPAGAAGDGPGGRLPRCPDPRASAGRGASAGARRV